MHVGDRDRGLADRGGDPLDGAMAGVADREHAGDARLVGQRRPLERPVRVVVAGEHVGSGEHVSAGIEGDGVRQPVGVGPSADEDEDGDGRHPMRLVGPVVAQLQPLQPGVAATAHDLGLQHHLDVRGVRDRPAQVRRHVLRQRRTADDEPHVLRRSGQVEGRLSGGVPAADDVCLLASRAPAPRPWTRRSRRRRRSAPRAPGSRSAGTTRPWRAESRDRWRCGRRRS